MRSIAIPSRSAARRLGSRPTALSRCLDGFQGSFRVRIEFNFLKLGRRTTRGATPIPGPGGEPEISSPPLSPGKRCWATAQSALGWYRPSVGVPESLDGKPSGVLN